MPNLNFRQQNVCCTTCLFFRYIDPNKMKNYSFCLLIGKTLDMANEEQDLLKSGRITVCDAWKRRPMSHQFKTFIASYDNDPHVDFKLIKTLRKQYSIKET